MFSVNLNKERSFSPETHFKTELFESEKTKVLQICFEPGQTVSPCVMEADVVFYTIEGRGKLIMPDTTEELEAGTLVVVPAGVERQIAAVTRLVVLAVQLL